ncbi:MAG TPA: branched-chain amino acid ABC transporter permease [Pseudonocardia sp.]|jgi:branched-chain amino acid transport system permease protein|nr:branched-chain amino acid ABC transporter permease [Pseudonocardia sp.]
MSGDADSRPSGPLGGLKRRAGEVSERAREFWAGASRWQRWLVYLLLIGLAVLAPLPGIGAVMSPFTDWTSLLFNPIGIYVLLALGLNVVVGYAGLLDLGYVAFFAIGAYTMAYMTTTYGFTFWPTLVLSVAFASVSGVILGAPTLRLRGDYLAIVTLGFGEIVRITAVNTTAIGGARGITNIPHPPDIFGTEFLLDPLPYYYVVLGLIVLTIVFSTRLEHSRVGRAWAAIREDEDAAELMGVPTFKFKLLAFAIGALVGGMAGGVFASKVIFIEPNNFPFILSATILAAVVLGGSGNIPGVIFGAFLIAWLPERFRGFAEYRILFFGAALVLVMALRPEGILPSRRRRAELRSGTGGLGALGAEVVGPTDTEAVTGQKTTGEVQR